MNVQIDFFPQSVTIDRLLVSEIGFIAAAAFNEGHVVPYKENPNKHMLQPMEKIVSTDAIWKMM